LCLAIWKSPLHQALIPLQHKEGGKYVLKNDVEAIEGLSMPDLI